jgi:hypothetical protein
LFACRVKLCLQHCDVIEGGTGKKEPDTRGVLLLDHTHDIV